MTKTEPKRSRGRPRKDGRREPSGRLAKPYKPRPKPAFVVSDDERLQVEQMAAIGEPHREIAEAFGLAVAELTERFAAELRHGRARRRRELVNLLFAKARAGNVSAQKRLESMTNVAPPSGAERKEEPLGKKETALQTAKTAHQGSDWGTVLQ